jgi:GNAT superfamily N-acetyltransferase
MPETGPSLRSGPIKDVQIVPAEQRDVPLILTFIRKLAEYEKFLEHVVADENSLRHALFGSRPAAEVILAYIDDQAVGFAVYFQTFSTFLARSGIYLEDLFVEPAYRSRGVGTALLIYLAQLTVQRGCARLSWSVLDWNQPAIQFYRKLGAVPLDEWTVFELSGTALGRLARSDSY